MTAAEAVPDRALEAAARAAGVRIRAHLVVRAVLDEAVGCLGEMLGADHVVARFVTKESDGAAGRWCRPSAAGRCDGLAALGVEWVRSRRLPNHLVTADLATDPLPVPAEESIALRAAGAGAVLLVPFDAGPQLSGLATLVRPLGPVWTPAQVWAAESVAADLGRGLLQAQLYEREQDLMTRLRELDNAKAQFVSTVSHELRTPLTSISGYVEMLRDGEAGPVNEAQARILGVIARNASRLHALIQDLLTLSGIEAGTLRGNVRPVDLTVAIRAAVAAIGPVADRAGVSVAVRVGGALPVRADPEQIDRVLSNLISNAVKFTPEGGRVEVTARREDDEVILIIEDTGIGIPAADQAELFARFFRATNATTRAIPGTGLGLAIARTIVANHGGRIDLRSEEGEGTTVTVRLPDTSPI